MSAGKHSLGKSSLLFYHISALAIIAIWGGSFVWTRVLIVDGLSPVEIYIYRFFIAYILIWIFCKKKLWSNSLKDEILLALCGICGGSIYFLAENNAVSYTLPSNVSLLTALAPLMTTMLIGLIYKNERPGKWIWIGSGIAMLGAAFIIFKNGFNLTVAPLGDLLALLAAFSWALYSLVLRKVDANYSAIFITRKTFFYGLLTAMPFYLAEPELMPFDRLMQTEILTNILILAVCASLIGYFVWSLTVQKLGAIKASNYLYFQPVATMIISAIEYEDDPITFVGCVGCVMIIAGVWLGDYMGKCER